MVPPESPFFNGQTAPGLAPPPTTFAAPPTGAAAPGTYAPPGGWDPYLDPAASSPAIYPPQGALGGPQGTIAQPQRLIQNLRIQEAWLAGGPGRRMELNEVDMSVSAAFPFLWNPEPLLVTPGFTFRFLEGPNTNSIFGSPDLPPQLYDAYLGASWKPRVNQWLSGDLGARVGVYSDFSRVNRDSIRVTGFGRGVVAFSPRLSIALGVVYLNRQNIKLLPSAGVLYHPSEETHFDLIFPEPRIAHRFRTVGNIDWWWYLQGRLGGGQWTIDRIGNLRDRVTYNDYRLGGGLEFLSYKGSRAWIDAAYVFNRQVLYESGTGNFNPLGTVAITAGLSY